MKASAFSAAWAAPLAGWRGRELKLVFARARGVI